MKHNLSVKDIVKACDSPRFNNTTLTSAKNRVKYWNREVASLEQKLENTRKELENAQKELYMNIDILCDEVNEALEKGFSND